MSGQLLYLSRADVRSLGIQPREAREILLQAFRDHAAGLNVSLPKNSLMLNPGHGFQAMAAASQTDSIATLKWVAIAPVSRDSTVPGINGLIFVNDYASGAPLAILDGDEITLVRTAALSAAAASRMAPANPVTIGFVGCGLQAYAHLDAFLDLYPSLTGVLAFSRSRSSAEELSKVAIGKGLTAEVVDDSAALLASSDIVISTVPGAPGLRPFLDARLMKPKAFASAVDLGRSWLPETLSAFEVLATDSLDQSKAPYDVNGNTVTTVVFGHDLAALSTLTHPVSADQRSLFCFKGFALADLALANLVVQRARECGVGSILPR